MIHDGASSVCELQWATSSRYMNLNRCRGTRSPRKASTSRRSVIAGSAHGFDSKPFGDDGVEFTVAVPRDQHLGAVMILCLDEGSQEMLAMPEREDQRLMRFSSFVNVGRIEAEFVGQPDQPQIFRDEEPNGQLKPAGAQQNA